MSLTQNVKIYNEAYHKKYVGLTCFNLRNCDIFLIISVFIQQRPIAVPNKRQPGDTPLTTSHQTKASNH